MSNYWYETDTNKLYREDHDKRNPYIRTEEIINILKNISKANNLEISIKPKNINVN